ncbi:death-associated inhibitor of apoptosis 1 isoform X3 [Contarinia nasturtii]|uniref:death-associated inhibitor of apoptosis 1 isoform X3 n=1 Tax=Contarinia nasturtii TaxID=265458 RepID=UPI0012D38BC9|nr:death-associated inhibitor of apoptosis 1 isoform X3 [Contarinia nasturtii]XP_031616680.1 death-associated inhibitor of apoptosis 1 isoform X3 [Contarinia nasturtii]XP_031616681.1 death-associated inhibitor of apoptosis 1 isoform X3 [Contarinia nasturtii]
MKRMLENNQSSSTSTTVSPDNTTKKQKKTSPPNTPAIPSQISANEIMYYEQERLKTFECNWPHQSIDPRKLAKIGLYFVGRGDTVTCPFCHNFLRHLRSFEHAFNIHKFYLCPLLCRFKTPNVPIQPESDLYDLLPPRAPDLFLTSSGRVIIRRKAIRD